MNNLFATDKKIHERYDLKVVLPFDISNIEGLNSW